MECVEQVSLFLNKEAQWPSFNYAWIIVIGCAEKYTLMFNGGLVRANVSMSFEKRSNY